MRWMLVVWVLWCAPLLVSGLGIGGEIGLARGQCADGWYAPTTLTAGLGPDEYVYRAMTRVENGREVVYLLGRFSTPSGPAVLARWDGERVERIAGGPGAIHGNNIVEFQGRIVVPGTPDVDAPTLWYYFWDGHEWDSFDTGFERVVEDLEVFDGVLYAAGAFFTPDPLALSVLLAFDGSRAYPIPMPNLASSVGAFELAVWDDKLFAGGYFEIRIDGENSYGAVAWDGEHLIPVNNPSGSSPPGHILPGALAMCVHDNAVFSTADTHRRLGLYSRRTLTSFDGQEWIAHPSTWRLDASQYSGLFSVNGSLYFVGTGFDGESGQSARVLEWTGSGWVPQIRTSTVHCLVGLNGDLLAGGPRLEVDGVPTGPLSVQRGERWDPAIPSTFDGGDVMCVHQGELVAGILAADSLGREVYGVARLRSGRWEQIGDLRGTVAALGEFQGDLVAAGTWGPSDPGNLVARWDGSAWQTVGDPLPGRVASLATHEGSLYAAVELQSLRLYRFTGNGWSLVPASSGYVIADLFAFPEGIVAIHRPNPAPTPPALWNGSTWSPWNAPIAGAPTAALQWRGMDILVGRFDSLDASVVAFDGQSWVPLDAGLAATAPGIVRAFEWRGELACVVAPGGANGRGAIVAYDGQAWRTVTDDAPAAADAINFNGTIAVSGPFRLAGDVPSPVVAFYGCVPCAADLTGTATPGLPGYGTPDGALTTDDFLYFLDRFAARDPRADLTSGAIPGQAGYAEPDGRVNNEDFFYYMNVYNAGC